ncbi:MAG: ABC transporter substrate-binding protein, partial [Clostridia bacterium]
MKKFLSLMLAVLLVCTATAGLAEGKTASVFYGGGTPLSIDPALNSASSGSNVLKLAQTGLMGYQWIDGKETLSPELAESYTLSEDSRTYVFTLREGLKWSDGTDFSASQLVSSWNRAASADLGADYGFMYDIIEGYGTEKLNVVADDAARTVTVTLINPTAYFLDLCAFPTFYPVKVENADNEGAWATKPGSYIGMTKYSVDDVIGFEKNPYYWNADAVKLDGVNCYLSEDNVAILTAYENGSSQFINSIDPTEYPRLQTTYPGELQFGPYIGTWYVLFNVHKDVSPVGKPLTIPEQSKARFAIGQMVNRQELVEFVTQGGQVPATGFYPNSLSDGLNAN